MEEFKNKEAFDAYWNENYVPLTYEDVKEAYPCIQCVRAISSGEQRDDPSAGQLFKKILILKYGGI